MSGGGTSSNTSVNNAQNNLDFYNTGTIQVSGNIGNGNTTQTGNSSTQGGSIGFSANVTLPSPSAPSGDQMPGLQELALIDDIQAHINQIRAPILANYQKTQGMYDAAMGNGLQELALLHDIKHNIHQVKNAYHENLNAYITGMGLENLALIDDIQAHINQIRAPILANYQKTQGMYDAAMGNGLQNLALIDDIQAHINQIRAPILANYQKTQGMYDAAMGQSLLWAC